MMANKHVSSLLFLIAGLVGSIAVDCPYGCQDYRSPFYEGLGCKAISTSESTCCPDSYDCSHLDKLSNDQCSYQGNIYNKSDAIPKDASLPYSNCVCRQPFGFRCTEKWCNLNPQVDAEGCYLGYALNEYCPVDQICPPKTDHLQCEDRNRTFYEGERFSLKTAPCTDCVCRKEGGVSPLCKKKNCYTELRHQIAIRHYCAPIYSDYNDCCPIRFMCPLDTEAERSCYTEKTNAGEYCQYGPSKMGRGTTFQQEGLFCECSVPPFVTCIQLSLA